MDILIRPRQMGKTTTMLEWLREAPEDEHRVAVCHSEQEAMRLYRSTFDEDGKSDLESWQFVGINEVFAKGVWSGVLRGRAGHIMLGIDNLDIILPYLLRWPVGLVTATATPL